MVMVISSLQAGGSERVMSIMANYWAEAGWDIRLMTLAGVDDLPFYELSAAVTQHRLGLSRRVGNPLVGTIRMARRIHRLRAALSQASADVILSFNDETNVMTVLATRRLGVPVIVAERNDPYLQPLKSPWRMLRPWAYRQAACVVAQTQHALDYFPEAIRHRGRVIPNPVVTGPAVVGSQTRANRNRFGKVLLGMGRLSAEKGFDFLIDAFARVATRHPDWSLEVWGEGRERGDLQARVSALGLDERVHLPGVTRHPAEEMRRADLFVLSSRHEGFPNVLCEAMACGLPVISFNCHSGPSVIIRDGVDGLLCPPGSVDALAAAMDRLMSSEAERHRLAAAAIQGIQRFALATVMRTWTELVTDACRGIETRATSPAPLTT